MRVKDQICGMEIESGQTTSSIEYNVTTYFFCSKSCKNQFQKNPDQYIGSSDTETKKSDSQNEVTRLNGFNDDAGFLKLEIPVVGMICVSCAVTIEKSLKDINGVKNASINFANKKVQVVYDPNKIVSLDLFEAVDSAGYQVGGVVTRIGIHGMSCASCVNKIEQSLKKILGLLKAFVNLNREEVRIEYLPELVLGDIVLVRPGEKIPVDGSVHEGRSSVAEWLITGDLSWLKSKKVMR